MLHNCARLHSLGYYSVYASSVSWVFNPLRSILQPNTAYCVVCWSCTVFRNVSRETLYNCTAFLLCYLSTARQQTKHVWNTHTQAPSLYILYIRPWAMLSACGCRLQCVNVRSKTFLFRFRLQKYSKKRQPLISFRKNFKIDRRTRRKTLVLRGIPPKRFFEAGHKLPIDIFYFLIFSDFYFSFFILLFYISGSCGWSVKLTLEQ